MRFIPSTLVILVVGILASAGLFTIEYIQVPEGTLETLAWLGHFHMVVLHMPIGLLFAWIVLQAMQWFMPHHDIDPAISTILFFTWVSALFAVFTGTFLDWFGKYSPELLEDHRQAALIFTALLTMGMTFHILRKWEDSMLWGVGYTLCLLGSSVIMIPTGHRGGTLTHGAGFLSDRAPAYMNSFLENEEPVLEQKAVEPSAEVSYFNRSILPIFEEYCTRCHGAEKQKGDLRMDSYAAMMEGGENGSIIDAEEPNEGSMWIGLTIELEDDLHMPPDGKPQVPDPDLETLKAWILAGASETKH